MKIVKPYVKYVENKDNFDHIAKAARICYAAEETKDNNYTFVTNLWEKRNHRSPYRHGTIYLEISGAFGRLLGKFLNSPYCTCVFVKEEYSWFISTNCQFINELDDTTKKTISNYYISYDYLTLIITKYPQVCDIVRLSFEIVTQVSTSRELNRVSPNNICEQSTRFCNFANEKFGKDITFCEPHWLDATTFYDTVNNEEIEKEEEIFRKREDGKIVAFCNGKCLTVRDKYPIATKGVLQKDGSSLLYNPITIGEEYIKGLLDDEERYFKFIKYGMKPQDARGILGLDVATKCFYTYSVKEWKHILDLRYKGTTGKPHPNAKIVAEQIYNKIKELGLFYNYE